MVKDLYKKKVLHLFYTTHDNRDAVIADRLNIKRSMVARIIQDELIRKFNKINQRVNLNYAYAEKKLRESKKNERLFNLVSKESKQ